VQEKLWSQQFVALSLINFLVYLVFYLLMVVVASYAMEKLGALPRQAGLAAGIFLLSALIGRLFAGRYIEELGRKKMMYGGVFLFTLMLPLYFFVGGMNSFYLVRFLHGFGLGCATSAIATIIVFIIPKSRLGEGLSYYALSTTIAMALGPLFGMLLYREYGFRINLWVCAGIAFITVLLLLVLKVDVGQKLEKEQMLVGNGLAGFFASEVMPISLISMLLYLAYSSLTSFLTSYVKYIDLVKAGGFYFLVYSAAVFLSRPSMGRLYDRYGNKVIYPSFIIFTLGMLFLGAAQNAFMLLLSAVCTGFGFGNFTSLSKAEAVKNLPPGRIGLANATVLAISEIGSGVGPYCLGFFLPLVGYRMLYSLMGVLGIIGMVAFYLYCGKKQGH